jgi:hypothetical protein
MSEPPVIPASPPITSDLPCHLCHYNLRTLAESALCPECATPISNSIQFHKNWGQLDLPRLLLGTALIACFPIPSLLIRLFQGITGIRGGSAWFALVLALAVTRAALLILGVHFIATSKKTIRPALSLLALGAAVIMGLIWIGIQGFGLVLTLLASPLVSSHNVLGAINAIYASATLPNLFLLFCGWIFMHDFALRRNRPGFATATHISFLVFLAGVTNGFIATALQCAYYFGHLTITPTVDLFIEFAQISFYVTTLCHLIYWLSASFILRNMRNSTLPVR